MASARTAVAGEVGRATGGRRQVLAGIEDAVRGQWTAVKQDDECAAARCEAVECHGKAVKRQWNATERR